MASSDKEDETSADGYGGMPPALYSAIVDFKKTGNYPTFCNLKANRNANFHWRNRCNLFTLVENTDLLMYAGNGAATTRVVVRSGETRLAIRYIHERVGHGGQRHTQALVARRLYWRNMRRDVNKYVAECEFCRKKRDMRKTHNGTFHDIEVIPSSLSAGEDEAMAAVCTRLLLTSEDGLRPEMDDTFYEANEDEVYECYEGDGYDKMLYEMDGSLLEEETAAAAAAEAAARFCRPTPAGLQRLLQSGPRMSKELHVGGEKMESPAGEEAVPEAVTEVVMEEGEGEEEGERVEERRSAVKRRAERVGGRAVKGARMGEGMRPKRREALEEENEELRDRLRVYESASGAILMPAVNAEVAQLQKNVLLLQEEVLLLKRQYLRNKLAYYPPTQYSAVHDSPSSESRVDVS